MEYTYSRAFMAAVAAVTCALLIGCGGTTPVKKEPEPVVVIKTKRVMVDIPDHLLKDCTIDAPPKPQEYIKATARAKEALLMKHAGRQALNLGKCNADKKALRDLKEKETKD